MDCDAPPAADSNGAVDAPVTTFGAVATYTCDDDFDLVGSTTLTCQADGTWDGTAPTCDRELKDIIIKVCSHIYMYVGHAKPYLFVHTLKNPQPLTKS